ncbi:MAG: bifunctional phosphoribosylaminoimidazolecarboxamide formyltransferase/IMP cyclohydrolase [Pseudomonadota bacterium]
MTEAEAERRPIRRALLSVSDKSGIEPLARSLHAAGAELISTGGTAAALQAVGLSVHEVAALTGFPEMLDGRVKTLHPAVHGAILARRDNTADLAALDAQGIGMIDLVVVNLYPFEDTVAAKPDWASAIESIDVGGPAMIRAAAKNHAAVAVVTDPQDYPMLLEAVAAGGTSQALRSRLALEAFARVAAYDMAIATWMAARTGGTPRHRTFGGRLRQTLRYGENPHQRAAFYAAASAGPGLATAQKLQGKALSYNNIADADAALELIAEFAPADGPGCAIIKHANPCGVAKAEDQAEAYRRARDADPTSAFGGIVAFNTPLEPEAAQEIAAHFTEVVLAPGVTDEAATILSQKADLRLLSLPTLPDPVAAGTMVRQVSGGFLVQDRDAALLDPDTLKIVTARHPEPAELEDLLFAWRVAKHVKSNAIVLAKDGQTVGIGAGQMSRVDSTRIAARKAQDMAQTLGLEENPTKGAAVASDAFFPFPDGVLAAARVGVRCVIQPGGSKRDAEVIAAADEVGLAMVLTGRRHFRH